MPLMCMLESQWYHYGCNETSHALRLCKAYKDGTPSSRSFATITKAARACDGPIFPVRDGLERPDTEGVIENQELLLVVVFYSGSSFNASNATSRHPTTDWSRNNTNWSRTTKERNTRNEIPKRADLQSYHKEISALNICAAPTGPIPTPTTDWRQHRVRHILMGVCGEGGPGNSWPKEDRPLGAGVPSTARTDWPLRKKKLSDTVGAGLNPVNAKVAAGSTSRWPDTLTDHFAKRWRTWSVKLWSNDVNEMMLLIMMTMTWAKSSSSSHPHETVSTEHRIWMMTNTTMYET